MASTASASGGAGGGAGAGGAAAAQVVVDDAGCLAVTKVRHSTAHPLQYFATAMR